VATRLAGQLLPAIVNGATGRLVGETQTRMSDAMTHASAAETETHAAEQWNAQAVITEVVSQLLASSPGMARATDTHVNRPLTLRRGP
jgi:hypothetical protein